MWNLRMFWCALMVLFVFVPAPCWGDDEEEVIDTNVRAFTNAEITKMTLQQGRMVVGINGDSEFSQDKLQQIRDLGIAGARRYGFMIVGPDDAFPKTGCDTNCVQGMCQAVGATMALVGTASEMGDQFVLALSLYDVEAKEYAGHKSITAIRWDRFRQDVNSAVAELLAIVATIREPEPVASDEIGVGLGVLPAPPSVSSSPTPSASAVATQPVSEEPAGHSFSIFGSLDEDFDGTALGISADFDLARSVFPQEVLNGIRAGLGVDGWTTVGTVKGKSPTALHLYVWGKVPLSRFYILGGLGGSWLIVDESRFGGTVILAGGFDLVSGLSVELQFRTDYTPEYSLVSAPLCVRMSW